MLPKDPVTLSACTMAEHKDFDRFMEQLKSARTDQLYTLLPDIQKLALQMSRPQTDSAGTAEKNPAAVHSPAHAAIHAACDILSQDFTRDIDLTALAAELHMSYESFRKGFRQQTGVSPARYRSQQRIRHAQLILSSGISIKETARMVGYGDIYAFTKQFTKTVGMPPGEYVRRMQEMLQSNR